MSACLPTRVHTSHSATKGTDVGQPPRALPLPAVPSSLPPTPTTPAASSPFESTHTPAASADASAEHGEGGNAGRRGRWGRRWRLLCAAQRTSGGGAQAWATALGLEESRCVSVSVCVGLQLSRLSSVPSLRTAARRRRPLHPELPPGCLCVSSLSRQLASSPRGSTDTLDEDSRRRQARRRGARLGRVVRVPRGQAREVRGAQEAPREDRQGALCGRG